MGNSKSTKKLDTSNTPANEGRKKKAAKAPPLKKPTPAKVVAPQPPVAKAVVAPKVPEEPVKETPKEEVKVVAEEPKVAAEEPKAVAEEPKAVAEEPKVIAKEAPVVPEEPKVETAPEPPKEVEPIKEEPKTLPPTETVAQVNTTSEEAVKTEEDSSHATLASKKMIDFYYFPPSPPSRAAMMTAKAVGVELNLKVCNLLEGEHMKEDFVKMNPQHCIPTIDDNGFIMWESRAIMGYLVSQYAKNDSLYPSSPKERAIVDQRLYFDVGTLSAKIAEYYFPVIFAGAALDSEKLKPMEDALGYFNTFLEGETFAAGSNLTIADISLVVPISNIDAFGYDLSAYPNIVAWYARTKEALAPCGYEDINQAGANMLANFFKSKLG